MNKAVSKPKGGRNPRGKAYHARKNIPFYIMLLPGSLFLLINNYLPMMGIVIAFQRYRFKNNFIYSVLNSKWVGFENFEFLFRSPDIWNATFNTIAYNVVFIFIGIALPVFCAIALNELYSARASKFYQTAMFLPYFLSWVVVAYLAFAFLSFGNGAINNMLLRPLGFDAVDWYAEPGYWPFILVFFNAWKSTGYNTVVYLAALSGINSEYYEAAAIDGATKWQQARRITLPMLKPTIIILALLSVGKIFNSDFGLFWNVPMNRSSLYPTTTVIDTLVYRMLRTNAANPGMPTAAGLFQAIVGCITVLVANTIVRKVDNDSALF